MIRPKSNQHWLGLVCDNMGTTFLAVRGNGEHATLVAQRHADLDAGDLNERGRLPELEQFVAEQQLNGCAAHVAFAGAGTVVQKLRMPPLSTRNRKRAVETRLTNYAGGKELAVDIRLDSRPSRKDAVDLLAGGVHRDLARGIERACRRAGLRPSGMTALAGAAGPPSNTGVFLQVLLGERTTTIQLFDDGRLVSCRDVLLGRRNFVAAYQRPLLTEQGPVTLEADDARTLVCQVGVPVGREDEIHPGIAATQLWPVLNPVLQQLRNELEQSLVHGQLQTAENAAITVLTAPALPGLGEFLAGELGLDSPRVAADQSEAAYLAALSSGWSGHAPLDLRPPELRFCDRMTRPALAAGLVALFIIFSNSATPRAANARLAELQPLADTAQTQLERLQHQRMDYERTCAEIAERIQREAELSSLSPAETPLIGPLKLLFGSVPSGTVLARVHLLAKDEPATLEVQATYEGSVPASLIASHWARALSDSPFFVDAEVAAVTGSGSTRPAAMSLLLELR